VWTAVSPGTRLARAGAWTAITMLYDLLMSFFMFWRMAECTCGVRRNSGTSHGQDYA
jgi:hypothetical protein